ncbi:hypothetical protein HY605_04480 [Candidatus Peregrinibacteria bacterium]|nr:hypothetical protein [Candidatus Peregrinibacteria bacterium]
MSTEINDFRNRRIDTLHGRELDRWLDTLIIQQLSYATAHCPVWRTESMKHGFQAEEKGTVSRFRQWPILLKEYMVDKDPELFVGNPSQAGYADQNTTAWDFPTGGTTGQSLTLYYTQSDWQAFVDAMVRASTPHFPNERIRAFNGYATWHLAREIFKSLVTDPVFRGSDYSRPPLMEDDHEALVRMHAQGCNVLIAPPATTQKGGSIEEYLRADPHGKYLNGKNVKMVLWSSTGMPNHVVLELLDRGIETILGYYGTTEVDLVGISSVTSRDPSSARRFQVVLGPTYTEILNENGEPVKSGEQGHLVASLIGGTGSQRIIPHLGTQILRYKVGDVATYDTAGGRTYIRDPTRVQNIEQKVTSGCQVFTPG